MSLRLLILPHHFIYTSLYAIKVTPQSPQPSSQQLVNPLMYGAQKPVVS